MNFTLFDWRRKRRCNGAKRLVPHGCRCDIVNHLRRTTQLAGLQLLAGLDKKTKGGHLSDKKIPFSYSRFCPEFSLAIINE